MSKKKTRRRLLPPLLPLVAAAALLIAAPAARDSRAAAGGGMMDAPVPPPPKAGGGSGGGGGSKEVQRQRRAALASGTWKMTWLGGTGLVRLYADGSYACRWEDGDSLWAGTWKLDGLRLSVRESTRGKDDPSPLCWGVELEPDAAFAGRVLPAPGSPSSPPLAATSCWSRPPACRTCSGPGVARPGRAAPCSLFDPPATI